MYWPVSRKEMPVLRIMHNAAILSWNGV